MSRSTQPIAKPAGQAEVVRPTVWLLGRFGDSLTLFTQLTGTVVVVLVGTILAEFLYQAFDLTRLSIFFLGSVIVSALAFGTRAAVFAALLAFVAYNFSLVEPRFSFRFAGADDTLTLAAFLVVALLTGSLAGIRRSPWVKSPPCRCGLPTLSGAGKLCPGCRSSPSRRWSGGNRLLRRPRQVPAPSVRVRGSRCRRAPDPRGPARLRCVQRQSWVLYGRIGSEFKERGMFVEVDRSACRGTKDREFQRTPACKICMEFKSKSLHKRRTLPT